MPTGYAVGGMMGGGCGGWTDVAEGCRSEVAQDVVKIDFVLFGKRGDDKAASRNGGNSIDARQTFVG